MYLISVFPIWASPNGRNMSSFSISSDATKQKQATSKHKKDVFNQPCLLEHFTDKKFVLSRKKGPHITLYHLKYDGTPYVNIISKFYLLFKIIDTGVLTIEVTYFCNEKYVWVIISR